jgi:serine/threonine protein kinase
LRPAVIFASHDRLWLRDAGLAATPIAAGEGPPEYRAPEQDRPILVAPGPATDVYQLAAIVYHLATGSLPGLDPAPPGLLRPDLSSAWEEPLLAALSSEPDQRPDMMELVHSLVEVLQAGGTTTC